MARYAFDVKLFATIRVNAPDEEVARFWLAEHLNAADANFGEWAEGPRVGQPILGEVSIDGEADLIEIDGEPV